MKKIINFKRILTALVCCCLLISGFSFGAGATGNNTPTIDDNATGTLKLYKYDNSSANNDGKGELVPGAQFTAYKVAEVSSQGVTSLIDNINFTSTTDVNKELVQKVMGKYDENPLADKLEEYVSYVSTTGVYTFPTMKLGIYLVVETNSPANYYATTDAFLVSIPQTNESGDSWEYNVEAYPKNKPINVEKFVTGDDIKADSYSIGDVVPFIVKSTIPEYSAKTYVNTDTLEYYFIDTMSDGLTFDNTSVEVYVDVDVDGDGDDDKLDATEYTVETENIEDATVKISLTSDAIREYAGKSITVKYSATLNEAAEITNGEMNSVTLTFTTNPQTGENHETEEKETKVYTYQMDVTKTFEGAPTVDLSKVLFTLKNSNGDSIFAKQVDGVWIVDTTVESVGDGFTDKLTLAKVGETPNFQYKLIIKGLDAGNYTLTEISTIPGYNLLKAPIEIEVIETKTGNVVTGVVKAKVDNEVISSTTGSFSFTVNNTKGFELPQTGGMGTWMYTLGGLLLMAASAVVMLSMRKRRAVK